MFSKRGIERLAGVLLVASFVAMVAHIVVLFTLGPGATVIQLVLIYGFLVFLSASALYLTFQQYERTLAFFCASGIAAHGLFVVLASTILLAGLSFPQEFALFGGEADSGARAASVLELTMDRIRTAAFVFLGLGLAPLGVLIVRTGAVARWIGWLGVVCGILVFFGQLADLLGVTAGIYPFITVLLGFVFMLVLGVRLLVWETRETTAGKPRSD